MNPSAILFIISMLGAWLTLLWAGSGSAEFITLGMKCLVRTIAVWFGGII